MTRAQVIAALVALLLVLVILELVRRRKLSEEFSLLWVVASAGAVVLGVWGGLLPALTRALGAVYGTSTLFFFGILFVLVVLVYYAVKLTALTQEVRRLAQEAALLRLRLEQVEGGRPPSSRGGDGGEA
jgi:hypothetical protein